MNTRDWSVLSAAARLVEAEALVLKEEAADVRRYLGNECDDNRADYQTADRLRGRAESLCALADRIRVLVVERPATLA